MTVSATKRFKYALEPLLAKHGWEVDTLRIELSRARQILEQRRQELDAVTHESASVLKAACELAAEGKTLDLARHQILTTYLAHLEEQAQAKQLETTKAQTLCDEILDQLDRALQALKGMETHKEKMYLEHREAVVKLGFAEADEAWLLRPRVTEERS